MRKEVLIAILVGFIFGLVITFGIWTANRTLKEKQTASVISTEEAPIPTPEPRLTPTPSLFMEITSPENGSIINNTKTTLTGKTQPGSTIVILTERGENVVEAESDGTFTSPVNLVSGTNEITVTVFSSDGDQTTKTLNLIYTTAQI